MESKSFIRSLRTAALTAAFLSSTLLACITADLHVAAQQGSEGTPLTQDDAGESADAATKTSSDTGDAGEHDANAHDAGATPVSHDAGHDAGFDPVDGPPSRVECSNVFGSGLSAVYGRLDGRLVAVVPMSTHTCKSDTTHVHLQVEMGGSIYDVAVNMDGLTANAEHAIVGGAWSEGWHTDQYLDYPTSLGIHSDAFTPSDQGSLLSELESVNHISMYATGFGPDGVHDVHRHSGGDGAIVTDPLSPTHSRFFVYRFATDTF